MVRKNKVKISMWEKDLELNDSDKKVQFTIQTEGIFVLFHHWTALFCRCHSTLNIPPTIEIFTLFFWRFTVHGWFFYMGTGYPYGVKMDKLFPYGYPYRVKIYKLFLYGCPYREINCKRYHGLVFSHRRVSYCSRLRYPN